MIWILFLAALRKVWQDRATEEAANSVTPRKRRATKTWDWGADSPGGKAGGGLLPGVLRRARLLCAPSGLGSGGNSRRMFSLSNV